MRRSREAIAAEALRQMADRYTDLLDLSALLQQELSDLGVVTSSDYLISGQELVNKTRELAGMLDD